MTVNPSITGAAALKNLDRKNELAANATEVRQEQAALDEAELRDLEEAQYYGSALRPSSRTKSIRGFFKALRKRLPSR